MEPDRIAALLAPYLGGARLTDAQLSQLATFLDLLIRWNARINLTAVRQPEQIVCRHFGESLFAARHLHPQLTPGKSQVVDIGSGAGFPGLPIKIYDPGLRVTLLESKHRKATFLREVVRTLQLPDIEVLATRAELYARQIANGKSPMADCAVTLRAVERFQQILPTAVGLLQNLPASHRRLALLIGATQVQTARVLAPTLTWSDPLPIPASSKRVLLLGEAQ
ncbi:MAG: 16S rRNA (guanine(527)-N(7))-methyltransferase RsmG [Acidobacteriia bacterium]|nr:16S rRNA (guanine(527)-N(7))-methyltransferase RsmG [Terriglobia bacterium]